MFWREPGSEPVRLEDAIREWSAEAFQLLSRVASRYQATISPQDLARRVQAGTGVATSHRTVAWLSQVLHLVAHRCQATGVPPLTSLVVNPGDGMVGPAYAEVLRVQRRPARNDLVREQEAARGRLECYRRFAADVPADAHPMTAADLARQLRKPARTPKTRATRPAASAKPYVPTTRICPTCFLETPAGEECQNCL